VPKFACCRRASFRSTTRAARASASASARSSKATRRSGIYKDVSNGIAAAGIEYWLPLFFEETATLFDYLPKATRALPAQHVPEAIRDLLARGAVTLHMLSGERSRPLLPPAELFLAEEPFFVAAKAYARVSLTAA
jgi:transcription-repair coupling factor (superfamily II helicase)